MSNIGKEIKDFFCNGFAGRRYDLTGSIIEAEGHDWIVIRTDEGEPIFMNLQDGDKQEYVNDWTKFNYDDEI
jgi:coenzyme F420-reducing hydrogenase beta subunit